MPSLNQKVPTTLCAVCRKFFNPGDRVITVFIVQKTGHNMETKDMGAWIGADFELMHASCADPSLEGNVIIPGIPR